MDEVVAPLPVPLKRALARARALARISLKRARALARARARISLKRARALARARARISLKRARALARLMLFLSHLNQHRYDTNQQFSSFCIKLFFCELQSLAHI